MKLLMLLLKHFSVCVLKILLFLLSKFTLEKNKIGSFNILFNASKSFVKSFDSNVSVVFVKKKS